MTIRWLPSLIGALLLFFAVSTSQAQQPPFIVSAFGGLFFPSSTEFKDAFKSSSDLIYGGGACLPVQTNLFIIVDYSFFKPEALLNASNDSTISLDERILHIGLLNKQPISPTIFVRLSAGINRITVKQQLSSSQTPTQTAEADRKIGYFGGVGIEELSGDPHVSFFIDLLYDYRRSRQKELYGDFGGLRAVIGAHLYMF